MSTVLLAVRTIFVAGLICGTLDGICAIALAAGRWMRMFQFIASGLVGPTAFQGGSGTAALGVLLHFSIALGAAAGYYIASRWLPLLINQALLSGVLYGAVVHFFMNLVVIPVSVIGRRPFALSGFLIQLAVHMIVVGPSISLTVRHYSH
jgi:hypothetical protein